MRVRVSYVVEIDDDIRRAIRRYYDQPGLATREEVKRWYEQYGSSEDDNLAWNIPDGQAPASWAK